MPRTTPLNCPRPDAIPGLSVRLADGDEWVFPAVTVVPTPDSPSGWWSSLGDEHAGLVGRYSDSLDDEASSNREKIESAVELAGLTLLRNYALPYRHVVWLVWGGVVDDDRRTRLLARSMRASMGLPADERHAALPYEHTPEGLIPA